jgi:hypothetical protein
MLLEKENNSKVRYPDILVRPRSLNLDEGFIRGSDEREERGREGRVGTGV